MARYWLSWWSFGDWMPTKDFKEEPNSPLINFWCTGSRNSNVREGSSDYSICALVKADSPSAAMEVIWDYWYEVQEWRFLDEKPDDWEPIDVEKL